MRLLGSTKRDIDKDKNSKNVPQIESVEVVLVHCNLVENHCQHTSKGLFSFVRNKQFGQLTLYRMREGGGEEAKRPPYQFFPCNSYKSGNWPLNLSDF